MKMQIPEAIKTVIRCDVCNELLSCGPVYLDHKTSAAICGRCSQQSPDNNEEQGVATTTSEEKERSRIVQYEAVAQLLSFPCAYSDRGCRETMDFSADGPSAHERDCEFRPFICPIVARGSCEWIGSRQKLSEHCRDEHPEHFLENSSIVPRPDLSKSKLCNYIISAFNFLFLLNIKVCVTSGKLFHSLRMFGNSEFLEKFSYALEVEGNDTKIKKTGSVLPSGLLTLQEPSACFITINSLLEILRGKYEQTKFTITIQTSLTFNCLNCLKIIENISDFSFCKECLDKLIKCEINHNSCKFVDVNKDKCAKHEIYFCKYQTKCCRCDVNFVNGSFFEHLTSANSCRKTISSDIYSVVRVTNTNSNFNCILLSTNIMGTLLCRYCLSNSNFQLFIYSSLPSYELKKFKCSIELTDPQTKHTLMKTPQIQYNDWDDWFIQEEIVNFPSWRNIGIDLKVNIDKI